MHAATGGQTYAKNVLFWIDERVSYVFRWNIPLVLRLLRRWERVGTDDKIVYVM